MSEPCCGEPPFLGAGASGGHREADAAHADCDQCADLEQLQPDRAAGRLGELGMGERDAAPRNSGLRSATARARLSPRVRRVFSLMLKLTPA